MDEQGTFLYCLVTSLLAYPERLAYQLLYDFRVAVLQLEDRETAEENALNDQLVPTMRELVNTYEDPKNFPQPPQPADGQKTGDQVTISRGNALGRDPRTLKMIIGAGAVLLILLFIIIVKSMSG
eukprot:UN3034